MRNGVFKPLVFSTIRNYVNEIWNKMERKKEKEPRRKALKYVQ